MTRQTVPLRAILLTTALLTLPAALAFAILVVVGRLDGTTALVGLLAVAALAAALIQPHVRGVAQLTAHLDGLADDEEQPLPSPRRPPLVAALASAIGRVKRHWQQQRGELSARITALDAVLESLPDPLLTVDNRLRVVRANLAAKELVGEDPVGRELSAALRIPALLEAAQAALRRGQGSRVEFEQTSPVKRWFVGRVERLAGRASGNVSLVILLHDLTAEKRTEQMRADFVANASHELRTPLATLLGFIETLLGPASQDARARERFLGIMLQQASRMSRLVDDLLSLSRIELREHTAPTEQVDVLKILRSVVDALQPQSLVRAMTIALDPGAAELPPVLGDPDELAQVFQNLVDNALKYGRPGTTVRLTARRVERCPVPIGRIPSDGLLAVAVEDEGEGIAQDQIPRLTERFYRVDAARSRELGGTGLGLAIVKHIVSRHRGALGIESEHGRGSRFTVYLPAARASRRGEEAASEAI